jgi:PAS domain-containing protein
MKANARFERQASVARLNRRNSHIAHIRRCIYYVTDPAAFIGECCSVALSFGAALVPGGGIGAEAEEALRRSEERYRSLAEAAHDMIFIVDRDDTIRYVNTFGASRFGLQPHEMIGKKRGEFFPSGESKRQKESLDRVFTSGEPYCVPGSTCVRWVKVPLVFRQGRPYPNTGVMPRGSGGFP